MAGKLSISACATSPAKDLKQRIPLDMVFVVVLFGLRRAIRTENSARYGFCGCPFRAQTGYSNREFWRMCSVWSSLSDSDRQFGQRIPADVLCVVVPFALQQSIRTENSGGCALCGRPFRTPTDNSDREFWRMCSVWSSLLRSSNQFEQRILADVLCVVVPFAHRRAIRTENSA